MFCHHTSVIPRISFRAVYYVFARERVSRCDVTAVSPSRRARDVTGRGRLQFTTQTRISIDMTRKAEL